MKSKIPFFNQAVLCIMLVCCCGCHHYYYVPATQQVPLFQEKNEFHANAILAGQTNSSSKELQVAYSLSNHLAVEAQYMHIKNELDSDSSGFSRGHYIGGGLGYFTTLGAYKRGIFEIFGGFGVSEQSHTYIDKSPPSVRVANADLSFQKIYLQPTLGFKKHGVEFAYSLRLSAVNFTQISRNFSASSINQREYDKLENLGRTPLSIVLEPAFTIRMGWKQVKFQLQFQGVDNLSTSKSNDSLGFDSFSVGWGLSFHLGKGFLQYPNPYNRRYY